jgi:FkbM family methyltransferase
VNQRIQYELRGWAYWLECANPFRKTVTARNLPLGLRIEGFKRDAVGRGLYRRGVHEPGLTKFLLDKFLKSGPCNFLDVGANLGYFSCLLGKLAGDSGKVVSIEPEPNNFKLLQRNLRNNGLKNVAAHNCAVGAEAGTAKMGIYKAANRGRHSLVDLESCEKFIEVPVRRLDDLLKDAGVESWDLMKLDVEGYEWFVFEGAAETLARTKMLAMEYAPAYWRKAGIDPAAVFQKLAGHFSRVHRFEEMDLAAAPVEDLLRTERTWDLVFQR